MDLHLLFAWTWIAVGLATGVLLGAFFSGDDWLGGYGSWPRRLLRLGHVSFVGTGLLNVAVHWTLAQVVLAPATEAWIRAAFVGGAIVMPLACGVVAFVRRAKPLFAVPVALLTSGAIAVLSCAGAHGGGL